VAFAGDAESEACVVTRFLLNGEHGARDAVLWLLVVHERNQVCVVFLDARRVRCCRSMDYSYWAAFDLTSATNYLVSRRTVEVRWAALLFVIILLTGHLLSYISTLRLHFV
jgi:hypothetical protein